MVRRFYVHNFHCLENFELPISGRNATLLVGKNGSGKSTVAAALELLQKIARGSSTVRDLVTIRDFARGRSDIPMRFELEVEISGKIFNYSIAFECPKGWKELRVFEESFKVSGNPVYMREAAKVVLAKGKGTKEASFFIDWHSVALPIIQQGVENDLAVFKEWMARMLILAPVPSLMHGDSQAEILRPSKNGSDFAAWFSGLLASEPSAYKSIEEYLKSVMDDFRDIRNRSVATDARSMTVQFANENGSISLPFGDLSDGEKCFVLCSLVLAANEAYGPLLCFWDEPDNFLALPEVGHFLIALRRGLQRAGQLIVTSHNPEAIRRFPSDAVLVLQRRNHLEPTVVRSLQELPVEGDMINFLLTGGLEVHV